MERDRFKDQIAQLFSLRDGWHDGQGKAPDLLGLCWLATQMVEHGIIGEDMPPAYLYPTDAGGVQVEWSCGAVECSLEVDLEQQRGQWQAVPREDVEGDEWDSVDLSTLTGWWWIQWLLIYHRAFPNTVMVLEDEKDRRCIEEYRQELIRKGF